MRRPAHNSLLRARAATFLPHIKSNKSDNRGDNVRAGCSRTADYITPNNGVPARTRIMRTSANNASAYARRPFDRTRLVCCRGATCGRNITCAFILENISATGSACVVQRGSARSRRARACHRFYYPRGFPLALRLNSRGRATSAAIKSNHQRAYKVAH